MIDNMSSAYSVSPYNQEDLLKIVGLTNQLESNPQFIMEITIVNVEYLENVGKKCLGATSLLGEFRNLNLE